MKEIKYEAIGEVRSSFKEPEGTPIQPTSSGTGEGRIILDKKYKKGLKDLEGFSHLIILYHCHKAGEYSLQTKPFMEDEKHGIFSIRAPSRPNSIGLSVVKLDRIEDNILFIKNIDMLDSTPVLDIKPYVPQFDDRENVKIGWLEDNIEKLSEAEDDGRFSG